MQPPDNLARNRQVIDGIEAYLDAVSGEAAAALARLEGKTDPESVKRRLAILIDQGRLQEAVGEVGDSQPLAEWVDLATFAFAATGLLDRAKDLVEWARVHAKPAFWQRSAIRFYDGSMAWAFRGQAACSAVPGALSAEQELQVVEASNVLDDLCARALALGRADNELEAELLTRLLDASYLTGSLAKCQVIVKALAEKQPIPLRVGYAVLQHISGSVTNVADRLWTEHGQSFKHRFLSCAILGENIEQRPTALARAYELVGSAKSDEDKQQLSRLLFSFVDLDDSTARDKVVKTVADLVGSQSHLLKLMMAESYLQMDEPTTAINLVEEVEPCDDPQASRIKALAQIKLGNRSSALSALQDFAKSMPSAWAYGAIADVASKEDLEDIERDALEHFVALEPNATHVRKRLVCLCERAKDFKRTAIHLEALLEEHPEDADIISNLAIAYQLDGQHARALETLDRISVDAAADIRVAVTRARILHSMGKAEESFGVLESVRDRHWNDPQFLTAYISAGHAAAADRKAHEALNKLLELKQQGLVDDHLLREASLDDLREVILSAAERSETITKHIIEGKFPWLLGAEMEQCASYWAWTLRTQKVGWLLDDRLNRASHCIYATNGFRAFRGVIDQATLEQIKAPRPGTEVVADASALMTLHSLDILDKAAEYCGVIHIPANYLPKVVDDLQHLFPHQLSQKRAAEEIKAAVDRNEIRLLPSSAAIAWVDEYGNEDENEKPPYRIKDLLDVLYELGRVTESQRDQATSVAHREAAFQKGRPALKLGNAICVAETTLVTLAGIGWLEPVTSNFSTYLLQCDYEAVLNRIRAFEALEEVRCKHSALWDYIQKNPKRFTFKPVKNSRVRNTRGEIDREVETATAAYWLAADCGLPLLADDRVCQALLLNERPTEAEAAFGTDALLLGLMDAGFIGFEAASDAFLKLFEWRYRFITAPPEILKCLAERYRRHPPGADLLRVAAYVHDCMRDEGLFAGAEPTNPPTSIGMRLYQTWAQNIADFLMDVWLDESYDPASAGDLTDWAIAEFLPSPPRVLDERLQSVLAALTPRTVITRALVRSTKRGDAFERANQGLRRIAAALEMGELDYLQVVAGVTNGL